MDVRKLGSGEWTGELKLDPTRAGAFRLMQQNLPSQMTENARRVKAMQDAADAAQALPGDASNEQKAAALAAIAAANSR